MRYDDILVGSLAFVLALVSIAICVGPWTRPYQLRSVAAIESRFGKTAARSVWLVIALASLTAGVVILAGIRPAYARPTDAASTEG